MECSSTINCSKSFSELLLMFKCGTPHFLTSKKNERGGYHIPSQYQCIVLCATLTSVYEPGTCYNYNLVKFSSGCLSIVDIRGLENAICSGF